MEARTISLACSVIVSTCVVAHAQTRNQRHQAATSSSVLSKVTGPREPINLAIAAGATATITLQPVAPKTVPASNYPAGTTITGSTIHLGSVPARVWFETHITGWVPEMLKVAQVTIAATYADAIESGGGFEGDLAECDGAPAAGAGDLFPAIVPCQPGTCENHPATSCFSDQDCPDESERCRNKSCQGNPSVLCFGTADCTNAGTTGPCLSFLSNPCRAGLSGITSPCEYGEPSRCIPRPDWYPPGGPVCQYAFFNQCDPRDVLNGQFYHLGGYSAVDYSTINPRFGFVVDPGEEVIDYHPTMLANLVLDVPANARGAYRLDYDESQTFMQNFGPPGGNNMPIAALIMGVLEAPCGRCCSGYDSGNIQCVDHVGINDCLNGSDQWFTDGAVCPPNGPDCGECAIDAQCDDGVACTVDNCLGNQTCSNLPNDAQCDDGQFCNGQELCSAEFGCTSGTPPCDSGLVCDEATNSCTSPSGEIPSVSTWGLVIMTLGLLAAAKLRARGVPVR